MSAHACALLKVSTHAWQGAHERTHADVEAEEGVLRALLNAGELVGAGGEQPADNERRADLIKDDVASPSGPESCSEGGEGGGLLSKPGQWRDLIGIKWQRLAPVEEERRS